MTSFILFSLWRLDRKVYQKLLHSTFIYQIGIEQKYNFPEIASSLYRDSKNIGPSFDEFFYWPIYLFISVSILFCIIGSVAIYASGMVIVSIASLILPAISIFLGWHWRSIRKKWNEDERDLRIYIDGVPSDLQAILKGFVDQHGSK